MNRGSRQGGYRDDRYLDDLRRPRARMWERTRARPWTRKMAPAEIRHRVAPDAGYNPKYWQFPTMRARSLSGKRWAAISRCSALRPCSCAPT